MMQPADLLKAHRTKVKTVMAAPTKLAIMLSLLILLFSGCGSQASNDKSAEVKNEAQQSQDTNIKK